MGGGFSCVPGRPAVNAWFKYVPNHGRIDPITLGCRKAFPRQAQGQHEKGLFVEFGDRFAPLVGSQVRIAQRHADRAVT